MSGYFIESFLIAEDGNVSSLGNFDDVQGIYSEVFFICKAPYSVPASYQYINKEGKNYRLFSRPPIHFKMKYKKLVCWNYYCHCGFIACYGGKLFEIWRGKEELE